jgi:hypothetical protein
MPFLEVWTGNWARPNDCTEEIKNERAEHKMHTIFSMRTDEITGFQMQYSFVKGPK